MKTIRTDKWEILCDERIQRFPSKIGEKRNIEVTIKSWIGVDTKAIHYSVLVMEEENGWWCESENAWVYIYGDRHSQGLSMEASVLSMDDAYTIAQAYIDCIGTAEHTVTWGNSLLPLNQPIKRKP